jgi:hypothetical protein
MLVVLVEAKALEKWSFSEVRVSELKQRATKLRRVFIFENNKLRTK